MELQGKRRGTPRRHQTTLCSLNSVLTVCSLPAMSEMRLALVCVGWDYRRCLFRRLTGQKSLANPAAAMPLAPPVKPKATKASQAQASHPPLPVPSHSLPTLLALLACSF